ncbi:Histidine kinase-, DNA gyrase B-, and HSP90-like ATPase [Sinomicrobium oceani]|uniref:Histidine kinase-, DNA gyrase B-, and HSP90-like ATPase n=1 Tax=Sinomicrobium oceani TaxID=1150368 RepID=A0A1K1MKT9_9FLAO|nr:ATP-binding protein [Sinomicrobium oceani]SFW23768.1 Histidine kinase-, DNA gyrase B-, and HSP90-like ATPase [Sinomicrobium oceani]
MKKHTAKITSKSIEQSGLPSDFKKAIAEYIWNGFDANASVVELDFDANAVGYINSFSISDNGFGINLGRIDETFGQFMDSHKTKTFDQNKFVKGKAGKGRFSFTTFCNKAVWETTFESKESDFLKYNITIEKGKLQDFQTSDKIVSINKKTGTKVHFESFHSLSGDLLESEEFINFLASEFGWFLFLNKESDYKIKINGQEIDYWSIIGDFREFKETINGQTFHISYIRWNKNIGDKYYYYFLNHEQKEVERKHTSFNNKAIDFHHSVYILQKTDIVYH